MEIQIMVERPGYHHNIPSDDIAARCRKHWRSCPYLSSFLIAHEKYLEELDSNNKKSRGKIRRRCTHNNFFYNYHTA
jgi:hypothetical protein